MGLFDDLSHFFETRLDEFLSKHPQLKLSILEEQLQEQEEDTLKLIAELQRQEKKAEADILATAKEIQRWHTWVQKARDKGRLDLAQAAQEREASLLRQGNQLWGKMQGCKERIEKAKELYYQIKTRLKEVRAKAAEAETARAQNQTEKRWDAPPGWNQSYTYTSNSETDPLEEKFRQWETENELEQMKRKMGR